MQRCRAVERVDEKKTEKLYEVSEDYAIRRYWEWEDGARARGKSWGKEIDVIERCEKVNRLRE